MLPAQRPDIYTATEEIDYTIIMAAAATTILLPFFFQLANGFTVKVIRASVSSQVGCAQRRWRSLISSVTNDNGPLNSP